MLSRIPQHRSPASRQTSQNHVLVPASRSDSGLVDILKQQPAHLSGQQILQLQRVIGNQSTQRLLNQPSQSASSDTPHIQRKLEILYPPHEGEYTEANADTLLNEVVKLMRTTYNVARDAIKGAIKRNPRPLIKSEKLYRVNNIYELIDYVMDPSAAAPQEILPEQTPMTITYSKAHGDYHFTGRVTTNKTQWTISQNEALALMEAQIQEHLETMRAGSDPEEATTWYIGAQADDDIGLYKEGSDELPTDQYTIQVVVNLAENSISYHGYPDQRLVKFGVGKTKSSIQ